MPSRARRVAGRLRARRRCPSRRMQCRRAVLDHAGAAQQFQVVEAFVTRNVAGLGHGDGVREQQAAAVAIVADALRDAGQPGDAARHRRRSAAGWRNRNARCGGGRRSRGGRASPLRRVEDHPVDGGFAGVEVGHPGTREHGEVGVREDAAEGADRRQRHDGIAHPIGGAHHYLRHRGGVEGHCSQDNSGGRIAVAE